MAKITISLPDPMKAWVEARLKGGGFSDTSNYVQRLIRGDQKRAQAIEDLQQAIDEGLQSGEPEPFDFKAFKAQMRERHARK